LKNLKEDSLWNAGLKRRRSKLNAAVSTIGVILMTFCIPAQAFEHPCNVVNDPDLTLNEKRAILASWASYACTLKAAPLLRLAPGVKKPVSFDDVVEALRALDRRPQENNSAARYSRSLRRHRLSKRSNSSDGNRGHGHTIH
jgi:hypothetical protein